MEVIKGLAPSIGLSIMLIYIIFIWTISSGSTWYYYLHPSWIMNKGKGKGKKAKELAETRKMITKKSKIWYRDNKRKFRRSLYVIYILCMSIGFLFGLININDWVLLVSTAISVVFVDITVFNTPFVRKIGKLEFQQEDELNEYVEDFKKQQQQWLDKVNECSKQIQFASDNYESIEKGLSDEQALQKFLEFYTSQFNIHPFVYQINVSYEEDDFIKCLNEKLELISKRHTIKYEEMLSNFDANEKLNQEQIREGIIGSLYEGNTVELVRTSIEQFLIIPIYIQTKSLLIVLQAEVDKIQDVDGPHIANLTYVFGVLSKS